MNRPRPGQDRSVAPQGPPAASAPDRPLYARILRLRHLRPSGLVCFVYFEGTFALGALLALAEAIPWWGVPVVPAVVAAMVKLNDTVADGSVRPPSRGSTRPRQGTGGAIGHGRGGHGSGAGARAEGRLRTPVAGR